MTDHTLLYQSGSSYAAVHCLRCIGHRYEIESTVLTVLVCSMVFLYMTGSKVALLHAARQSLFVHHIILLRSKTFPVQFVSALITWADERSALHGCQSKSLPDVEHTCKIFQ